MKWYKIQLTQTQVSNGFLARLSKELETKIISIAADGRALKQLAAFSSEAKSDCAQTIYISPGLASVSPEILSACGAEACVTPTNESLSVFASWGNNEAAWEVLRSSGKG